MSVWLTRYPFHAALAALAAGLALAPYAHRPPIATAALTAICLVAVRAPPVALLALAAAAGGLLLGAWRLEALDGPARSVRPGERLAARATLLERPQPSRFGSSAPITVEGGARLLARAGAAVRWPGGGGPGQVLQVEGELRRPVRAPGAALDWPAYLRRRGIAAELSLTSVRATGERRGGPAGAVDSMRRRSERALGRGLSGRSAALMRGMVLGQDEEIDPLVREDFRRSGLAHLLAVSGQNVMLLCALALPLVATLRLRPRGRAAVLGGLIALYVPLAGAGPSLQRAGVMGAAALAALAAGRPASRWYALLLAAAATLMLNPRVAGDAGWRLSFAAVVGIALLGPGLRGALAALPRPLADGAAVTVAATLATAPLLAHEFGYVSAAGLGANLLALPLVPPIMWLGMLEAALAQLSAAVPELAMPVDAVSWILGRLASVPLAALAGLAVRFAELPGASVSVSLRGWAAVAAAYGAIAAAVLAARRLARRAEPRVTALAAAWRRVPRTRRALTCSFAAALAAFAGWSVLSPPAPPDRLTVSFLDAGQGDATLIQDGAGTAVLFDAGPPEARVYRQLRAAGVSRLDLVVVTHPALDHDGGLGELLARIPVAAVAENGEGATDRRLRALVTDATRRGARRIVVGAGQVLRVGRLTIRVLSPPAGARDTSLDENARAVAAVVSVGAFDLFVAGDAESDALAGLRLPPVEAMKVSHHGSADPGLPDLLARLRPRVAAIEVGKGNPYGHPTPSTLAALRTVPRVYRTDRDGMVRLTLENGGLTVSTDR